MQLEKVYEPQRFEPHWAQWWIESELYRVHPKQASNRVFSLVIPPPNVTGSLHIGHMLDHTVMDVAVRWHRMRGETTLWLPGTDHAGIATQMVVERQLAAEGLTKAQIGREEFERRVWQWKEEYGGRIKTQIRREGASVDWSRERFTMDAGLSRAVRETFVRLWEKGLVYRGEYMVNWCPACQTAISDVETTHESVEGHLWHIRYKVAGTEEALEIATTRPETMLGDTALAVHPDDPRYRHLVGKMAILPLIGREIPVIADTMADPKFGTGVVKITPAHDPNDFEAGKRNNLPSIKVIGEDARMTAAAGRYAGLDRFEARKRIVAALEESGELVKTEPYTVNIGKCDRSKTIVEPLVSTQWFVRMKPLAAKAIEAVKTGQIRFVPDDREIVFFQWMENIRDWCISRQLWWGHRIPAWHCRNCQEFIVAREVPAVCPHCQSTELVQDSDVLDTWFSSGLWPFSTFGWPDETEDLKTFYPTSLLITGFDILFFWVSRMIMLGIECTGQVPFREVHMHGLVRDAERQKMSKTKGNVVDPLDIMARYGTDACRVALLVSASPGTDIALKEDRMDSARSFANKLWNASRLLFMNMERSQVTWAAHGGLIEPVHRMEDAWIVSRLNHAIQEVNAALRNHRYHEAAQSLWDFVWKEFCDWYLEFKKLRFEEGSGMTADWQVTLTVYETTLRLLHPLMPFITEELWQRLVHGGQSSPSAAKSVSLAQYPESPLPDPLQEGLQSFLLLQQIVTVARELRADNKLDPKSNPEASLYLRSTAFSEQDLAALATLTKLQLKQYSGAPAQKIGLTRSLPGFDLQIHAAAMETANAQAESAARSAKEKANLTKVIAKSKAQLGDETFLSKAPDHVVLVLRQKLAEYEAQLEKLNHAQEGSDKTVFSIDHPEIVSAVERALAEDIGTGDMTSQLTVLPNLTAHGTFLAKQDLILAGIELLPLIYGNTAQLEIDNSSGAVIKSGTTIARVQGPARLLLERERVALNFLQRLSGVATLAGKYVSAVAGTGVKVLDTRKTTPGLRRLEKMAAAAGGATNHRQGLFDAVLIKNNHITAAGGVKQALAQVRDFPGPVEIEVRTRAELEDALEVGAKRLLLDNLTPAEAAEWIRYIDRRATVELSGGIDPTTIRAYAEAGPDFISCGAITHSATAVDISFRLELDTQ